MESGQRRQHHLHLQRRDASYSHPIHAVVSRPSTTPTPTPSPCPPWMELLLKAPGSTQRPITSSRAMDQRSQHPSPPCHAMPPLNPQRSSSYARRGFKDPIYLSWTSCCGERRTTMHVAASTLLLLTRFSSFRPPWFSSFPLSEPHESLSDITVAIYFIEEDPSSFTYVKDTPLSTGHHDPILSSNKLLLREEDDGACGCSDHEGPTSYWLHGDPGGQTNNSCHGSPQVSAVHRSYIAMGMSNGYVIIVPSKYSIHQADDTQR